MDNELRCVIMLLYQKAYKHISFGIFLQFPAGKSARTYMVSGPGQTRFNKSNTTTFYIHRKLTSFSVSARIMCLRCSVIERRFPSTLTSKNNKECASVTYNYLNGQCGGNAEEKVEGNSTIMDVPTEMPEDHYNYLTAALTLAYLKPLFNVSQDATCLSCFNVIYLSMIESKHVTALSLCKASIMLGPSDSSLS